MWSKFLAGSAVFFAGVFLAAAFSFKNFVFADDLVGALASASKSFILIVMLLVYLLLIIIANVNASSWKKFFHQCLESLKKLYFFIPAVLIIFLTLMGLLFAMYQSEQWPLLVLLLAFLMIVFAATARVFWILLVNDELRKTVDMN